VNVQQNPNAKLVRKVGESASAIAQILQSGLRIRIYRRRVLGRFGIVEGKSQLRHPAGIFRDPRESGSAAQVAANNRRGALFMMAGVANVVANSALIKFAGQTMPSSELVFVQGALMTAFLFATVLAMRVPLRRDFLVSGPVQLRSVLDAVALMVFFIGLPHLQLANAIAIGMAQPVVTAVLAALVFRESLSASRWLAIGVGFVGVLLIVQPASDQFNAWSLPVLLSSLLAASRDVVTRWVDRDIPSMVLALVAVSMVTPFAAAGGIVQDWRSVTGSEAGVLAAASGCLAVGYIFVTAAIRQGELGAIAPFRYAGLIFSVIVGYVVWQEVPNHAAVFGMVLIIFAGLYLIRGR
jgi:drug/metabolite transporter (DMT)-like permease